MPECLLQESIDGTFWCPNCDPKKQRLLPMMARRICKNEKLWRGQSSTSGPGGYFHRMIRDWLGEDIEGDCGCAEMIAKMNGWGWEGCKKHAGEIAQKMVDEGRRRDMALAKLPGAKLAARAVVLAVLAWGKTRAAGGEKALVRHVESRTYVTAADLARDTVALAGHLPPRFDAVVGAARSGMIPAALLAAHLHVPLYAAADSAGPVHTGHGQRLVLPSDDQPSTLFRKNPQPLSVLVVEDTICSGRTLAAVRDRVAAAWPAARIETAAIYAAPKRARKADYVACILPFPHWLEWNLFNSGLARSIAFDLDGVIADNADPARAIRLPKKAPLGAIITARLESERETTLAWLAAHGIRVKQLIMGPWATPEDRHREPGTVARWKAAEYAALGPRVNLYVESEEGLAREIARLSKRPVLCPAAGRIFNGAKQ